MTVALEQRSNVLAVLASAGDDGLACMVAAGGELS
jgi:hypothetical protein